MRKVTLGLATSLDNYIARVDGGADWMLWTTEVADLSAKFMKTVDAILIGRKTYEVMLASGETSYPGATNYVFSRSQKKLPALAKTAASKKKVLRDVEFVATGAVSFVKDLKQQKGSGIVIFGGGKLASSLFNADLIDEVVLNVHPVILGSGIPLFPEIKRQINLELFEVKRLKNGCIVLSYRIQR
ncbi:MAG: dihydrofolate reductase family protein [Acidobacteriota bacterium]